jgi:non-homologous end joining protein Ku
MIALEPRGKGLMGTLLRYPYEVRDEADYFEDIPNIKIEKEMLDLAKHIVQTNSGHFAVREPEDGSLRLAMPTRCPRTRTETIGRNLDGCSGL